MTCDHAPISSARFLKNTSFNLIGQIISFVCGIVTSIILARWLGPDRRGILAIVLLLPALLNGLLASGFGVSISYFIASGKWKKEVIVSRALGIALILLLPMLMAGSCVLVFHEYTLPDAPLRLLSISLVLLPIQLLGMCFQAIMSGKIAFREKMYFNMFAAPASCLLTALLVVGLNLGIAGALFATLGSAALSVTLSSYFSARLLGKKNFWVLPSIDRAWLGDAFSFGLVSHIANVAGFLNYRVDLLLINFLLGSSSVGIYVVAVGISEKLWLLVSNVAGVLFPTSAQGAKNNSGAMAEFTARLSSILLMLLLVFATGLALIATPLVSWIFGIKFEQSGLLIVFLLPGITAMGYTKILASYIAGIGKPGVNALASSVGVVVNVVVNLMLIPWLGIYGAAIATSISYTIVTVIVYLSFLRITGIDWQSPIIPSSGDLRIVYSKLLGLLNYRAAST